MNDVCDRISEALSLPGVAIFQYDLRHRTSPVFFGSHVYQTQEVAHLRSEFFSGQVWQDSGAYKVAARAPVGAVMTEAALMGLDDAAELPPNSFRERLLQATGARARTVTKLNSVGPFLDCVITNDALEPAVASPAFRAWAPNLVPLLALAMEGQRVVTSLADGYAALKTLFDRLNIGVAFMAPDDHVLLANPTFRAMAAEGDCVTLSGERLECADIDDARALAAALNGALRGDLPANRTVLILRRRSGGLPMIARVVPVKDGDLGHAHMAMLVLIDPEEDTHVTARGLDAFHLLTPAELEVCDLIVKGFRTDEVAELRQTKLQTTRSQIKDAMAKLMCDTRLDMLRLALATSPNLIRQESEPHLQAKVQ
ncbi:hypothetical protein ATO6_01850 [Oceanicola sp. 22II-s10i]|nr:hypothetical protein ATO6_01850 [Oceanicola sp. 22II-s10i]